MGLKARTHKKVLVRVTAPGRYLDIVVRIDGQGRYVEARTPCHVRYSDPPDVVEYPGEFVYDEDDPKWNSIVWEEDADGTSYGESRTDFMMAPVEIGREVVVEMEGERFKFTVERIASI